MKCCVYVMHGKFSGSFRDYTIFIFKFATDERFLFKLETFKNCKEVKHIMIMIIAVIYIFLCYVIFDEQLKINSKDPQTPLKKFTPSCLLTHPLKLQKLQVPPPFLSTLKIFQNPPADRGGGGRLIENLQVTQSNQTQLIKVKSARSFRGVFRTQLKILSFVP